jgi:hypothetical protein
VRYFRGFCVPGEGGAYVFTREYTQCTAGYTFCFVVVVVVVVGAATFNQTWQFQLTVDET